MQKAPIPNIDDLVVPQFESEAKRTCIKVTSKQTAAPVVEGTSVMPRQRPKGNPNQPLSTVLPITISASPTNIPKKSQSPVTTTETFPTNTFQNFPPIQTFQTSPNYQTPVTTSAFHPQQTFFQQNSSQEKTDNSLDNLFQSSVYPDPFRDETPKKIEIEMKVASSINNIQKVDSCILPEVKHVSAMSYIQSDTVSPNGTEMSGQSGLLTGNGQGKTVKGLNSKMESSSQCMMAESPATSPTLTVPKGHRRNMSDTTAFNK